MPTAGGRLRTTKERNEDAHEGDGRAADERGLEAVSPQRLRSRFHTFAPEITRLTILSGLYGLLVSGFVVGKLARLIRELKLVNGSPSNPLTASSGQCTSTRPGATAGFGHARIDKASNKSHPVL